MLPPFSAEDLNRAFDARALTRGRTMGLLGSVVVTLGESAIDVVVDHLGQRHTGSLVPTARGAHVSFANTCSCAQPGCPHLAAGALAALDRFPALRRAAPSTGLDILAAAAPSTERQQPQFELHPGEAPHPCFVACWLVGDRSGKREATTPARLLAGRPASESIRILAKMLGGDSHRTPIPAGQVAQVLGLLGRLGKARWHATGKPLRLGAERSFPANVPPALPPQSAVIIGDLGPWYVDAATGELGRIRLRPTSSRTAALGQPTTPASPRPLRDRAPATAPTFQRAPAKKSPARRPEPAPRPIHDAVAPMIEETPLTVVLRLRKIECPGVFDNAQRIDALMLDFDYDGTRVAPEDERQFVPTKRAYHGTQNFVRRDRDAEAAAIEQLRQDGFTQMRIAEGPTAKGRMGYVHRDRDAAERWLRFLTERLPALTALGWQHEIDPAFGPSLVEQVGDCDVRVTDAAPGSFALDFGIEIDGRRTALLPLLQRLLDRGGMAAAQIIDGCVITSLDDGRIIRLPAERVQRLLSVMEELIAAARRTADGSLLLPQAEAPGMLELEDLLTTRWENAQAIAAYTERYRGTAEIPPATLPRQFQATLRPYQQHGVDWLQHLRANGLGGFLADDMGLGKTAQTIAHICIEHAEGRLDRPALIVLPTSLVANWRAELAKFAPHLTTITLHGQERHALRAELDGVHVVLTTYTVLTRDIAEMALIPWHLVVLDEAQVIKSPDSKSTRAVCQLETRHRVCLSGTPIENHLGELWSEFAFLMPGLLGDRKTFAKRYRTPIEVRNDAVQRAALARRIRPFLLRRTKSEVATELPPKHTILRRINLAPAQRELYETIRGTLYETVREQVEDLSPGQRHIIVLDALLKLRQVCCDPRLVKLPAARLVDSSSKLDDLMEMVTEMIPEGRRILLFSQFTSMLDLIKPRLAEAGIPFVELRGDTRDRAEPVRSFEAGEVPLFLISLKAGGRGLNLTSADTVIHYDPWWNPAVEDQASDRAHRIGQTKSVFVYKMIAADTVEDRIVELQQRKADLAGLAFEDVAFLMGETDERIAA